MALVTKDGNGLTLPKWPISNLDLYVICRQYIPESFYLAYRPDVDTVDVIVHAGNGTAVRRLSLARAELLNGRDWIERKLAAVATIMSAR